MKFALFFLLSLVSLSYQEYFFPGRSYYDPRMPYFYYPPQAYQAAESPVSLIHLKVTISG